MRLNHYWMIEHRDWWNNRGWLPYTVGGKTRQHGRDELKKWRKIRNHERYRLVKYISMNVPNPYEVQIHCDRCGIPCHCGGEPI